MPSDCPTALTQLQAWVAANPIKVQALIALVLGNAPAPLISYLKVLFA